MENLAASSTLALLARWVQVLLACLLLVSPLAADTSAGYRRDACAIVENFDQQLIAYQKGDYAGYRKLTRSAKQQLKSFSRRYRDYRPHQGRPPASRIQLAIVGLEVARAPGLPPSAAFERDPDKRQKLLNALPRARQSVAQLRREILAGR